MSDEIRYRFIEDGDFIVFEDGRIFKKARSPGFFKRVQIREGRQEVLSASQGYRFRVCAEPRRTSRRSITSTAIRPTTRFQIWNG